MRQIGNAGTIKSEDNRDEVRLEADIRDEALYVGAFLSPVHKGQERTMDKEGREEALVRA